MHTKTYINHTIFYVNNNMIFITINYRLRSGTQANANSNKRILRALINQANEKKVKLAQEQKNQEINKKLCK